MRKKSRVLLAIGLAFSLMATESLFAEYNGYYDSYDSSSSSDATTSVTNQTTTNDVIGDSVKNEAIVASLKKGTLNKPFGYAATQFVYNNKVKIFNIPIGYYNIGHGFGVEATIPIVSIDKEISRTGKSERGVGDIAVGVNYHFGEFDTSGLSFISFSYKSKTGNEKKSLGSGAYAYITNFKYLKGFDKYMFHFQGTYTINNDATINGTRYDYGNSYLISTGGSMPCLLSNKITTSAKLTYFHANATKYSWGYESGKTTTADLWIQWDSSSLIKNFPIGWGIKIPLKNEVDDKSIGRKFSFYLSASTLF